MRALKETILRITSRHREERLTTSKLVNIVFLCDVNAISEYRQKLTGAVFTKTNYGIKSEDVRNALEDLTEYLSFSNWKKGMAEPEINFYGSYTEWTLTKRALRIIDEVINLVKNSSCTRITEVINEHPTVEKTQIGEDIDFRSVPLAKDYNDWQTQL